MKNFGRLAAIVFIAASAAISCSSPSGKDAVLKFRQDGTFKVLQVTDTHLGLEDFEGERSFVTDQMARVLEVEKPDIVVFTGDIVTSGETAEVWRRILKVLDEAEVPFAVLYGNHDREEQFSDRDLPQCYVNDRYCVNTLTEDGYLDDLAVPVKSYDGSRTAAVLYLMDSGDYSTVAEYMDYGWISHDQVHWYVEKCRAFTVANGNVPVPSYAFFHIPLNEYNQAYTQNLVCGQRFEKECPGELNSGLLSAIEDNGDIHGVFVGHDHDNDYVARIGNVAMVYGRCGFYKSPDRPVTNGLRIIELTEGDYGFRTWVREAEGAVDDIRFEVNVDYRLRTADAQKGQALKQSDRGITRTMYAGVTDVNTVESAAIPLKKDTVATPRMYGKMGEKDYGAVHEGYLYFPETGVWGLQVSANDDAVVFVDDLSFRETSYGRGILRANFEKGYHHIKILHRADGPNCWLKLMWRPQSSYRFHEILPDYYLPM